MKCSALLLLILAGSALGGVYQKRVIEGANCPANKGRHHVILTTKVKGQPNPKYHCGGSLIHPQWVLTAKHCDVKNLVAILNPHPVYGKHEVADIIERHFYKTGNHDIMLLKVKTITNTKYPTVTLPNLICVTPGPGTKMQFMGWFTAKLKPGGEKEDSTKTVKLQCGDLNVTRCGDMSKYKHHPDPSLRHLGYDFLLCGKNSPNVDACRGDSGGSFTNKKGALYGVLITSPTHFCALPVRFMNVCRYRKWINEITKL